MGQGKYSSLHPGLRNQFATVSYKNCSPALSRTGILTMNSDSRAKTIDYAYFPALSVSERLPSTYRGPFTGSASRKIASSTMLSTSKGDRETQGDACFMNG